LPFPRVRWPQNLLPGQHIPAPGPRTSRSRRSTRSPESKHRRCWERLDLALLPHTRVARPPPGCRRNDRRETRASACRPSSAAAQVSGRWENGACAIIAGHEFARPQIYRFRR
jgi:hypothetical protein